MTRSLNRVSMLILVAFFVVATSLVYWGTLNSDSMLARDDNPRRVEAERALLRGTIYDRAGRALAQTLIVGTSPSGQPVVRRDYPFAAASSAVGYYSLVHGVGGVEAAFDKQLRGDDLRDAGQVQVDALLHRPQVGSDVRLTLDVQLQTAISAALLGRRGAVIAIDVPSGAVLAMVSVPTFDPNTLDQAYDALLKDPAAPLLNRVTQGLYQPGGALETVLLAAMLTDKADLNAPVSGATAPLQINGLTLTCAAQPSSKAIALKDAYGLACPSPFAEYTVAHPANVQNMLGSFGLFTAPSLANFQTISGPAIAPLTQPQDAAQLRPEGVGQGELTVTPLQMALAAATIANNGNAISPYVVDATRAPGAKDWTALDMPHIQKAVVTQDVANGITSAMRDAVTSGAGNAADRPDVAGLLVHGHASTAYTGPNRQQIGWFIGYAMLPNGHAIAVTVTVEDADAPVAARIGGATLAQAAQIVR